MSSKLFGAAVFGAVAFGAVGLGTAMPEAAQAATFTVNGTLYDITTVRGSYNSLQTQLQATPWWNNTGLASQFANTVLGNLGFPNQAGSNLAGPFFAYDFRPNPSNLPPVQTYRFTPAFNGSNAILSSTFATDEATYAVATVVPAQPIPTPALLPGLIGLGAVALRKCKQKKVEA